MSMVPGTSSQLTLRVSDADRDGVISRLRDGYAEGRFTTRADLQVLTEYLPVPARAAAPVAIGRSD